MEKQKLKIILDDNGLPRGLMIDNIDVRNIKDINVSAPIVGRGLMLVEFSVYVTSLSVEQ